MKCEVQAISVHPHLIAHNPCEVLQELLESAEFFGTDCDNGALEELVIVDEKSNLQRRQQTVSHTGNTYIFVAYSWPAWLIWLVCGLGKFLPALA